MECGKQDGPGLPVLDICRLELRENGALSVLVRGTTPGSTDDISIPIVSPEGRWLAFQRSNSTSGDISEGYGVYLLPSVREQSGLRARSRLAANINRGLEAQYKHTER
ncbi:MAG: hypothetical protein ABIT04_03020 [Novosphingobium sp.]